MHTCLRGRDPAHRCATGGNLSVQKIFCRNFSAANRISDFLRGERTIVLRCALAHRHAIAVADRMDEAGDTLFCYLEGAHGASQKVKDFASASLKLIQTREKEQVLTSRHAGMFESPPQL
ncbi:MAG: hypothetical protein ACJ8FK_04850 [Xanthobacteraceae bacterium]